MIKESEELRFHLENVVDASEHCPRCEKETIKEELYSYIQDDDIEIALEVACEKSTECRDCHLEEMADNNRM